MARTLTALALIALLSGAGLHAARAASDVSASATSTEAPEEAEAEPDPRRAARRLALERTTLSESEKVLIERPDRERPEHPVSVPLFGRPLTFGGRYTVVTRYDDTKLLDFDYLDLDDDDLDNDGDLTETEDAARGQVPTDDQLRVNQALQLDLFYPFSERFSAYAEGKLGWRNLVWAEADQTRETDEWLLERGEMWLYMGNLFGTPFALQPGRQRFWDEREWWWDDELDAVRLRFDLEQFHAEVAVAEELFPVEINEGSVDPEDDDVLHIFGSANWAWAESQQVGLYALHRNDHSGLQDFTGLPCIPDADLPPFLPEAAKPFFRRGCVRFEDESDADLTWFGLSAAGRLKLGPPGRLYYWLDAAGVVGKETFTDYAGPRGSRRVGSVSDHHVSGGGVDVGATWESRLPGRPSLTLGYAFGSGRSGTAEDRDRGFRQTGLQDNSDKFRGVQSFRYYGELLDPELSNLHVVTAGLGLRFLRKSSIDFVYHLYRQAHAAPYLRDVGFKRDPDGVHRSIGQEWDLILGIEEYKMFEIKLVGAIFRAGQALTPQNGKLSYLASLRLRMNF